MSFNDSVKDLLDFMLEKGAEVNMENKWGETPLHAASSKGLMDNVQYLIVNGADVDATNTYGETALHKACRTGCLPLIKVLVGHGANIFISGYCGTSYLAGVRALSQFSGSPLTVARSHKCQDVVEYLQSLMATRTSKAYQVHQRPVNYGPSIDNIDIAVLCFHPIYRFGAYFFAPGIVEFPKRRFQFDISYSAG